MAFAVHVVVWGFANVAPPGNGVWGVLTSGSGVHSDSQGIARQKGWYPKVVLSFAFGDHGGQMYLINGRLDDDAALSRLADS